MLRGNPWTTKPPEMWVLVLCGLYLLFSILYCVCLCSSKMQSLKYVGSLLPANVSQRLYVEEKEDDKRVSGPFKAHSESRSVGQRKGERSGTKAFVA